MWICYTSICLLSLRYYGSFRDLGQGIGPLRWFENPLPLCYAILFHANALVCGLQSFLYLFRLTIVSFSQLVILLSNYTRWSARSFLRLFDLLNEPGDGGFLCRLSQQGLKSTAMFSIQMVEHYCMVDPLLRFFKSFVAFTFAIKALSIAFGWFMQETVFEPMKLLYEVSPYFVYD